MKVNISFIPFAFAYFMKIYGLVDAILSKEMFVLLHKQIDECG